MVLQGDFLREVCHPPFGDCFDNHVDRDYHFLYVHPIAASMGAEVRLRNGYTLTSLCDQQVNEIQHALYRHKMIFFRHQKMTLNEQEDFSTRLGDFAQDAYTEADNGHPHVLPLIREAHSRSAMVIGSGWHVDSAFLNCPPSVTILRSVEVPPFGGDTIFANSALALQTLSPVYRTMIQDLKVRFSMQKMMNEAVQTIDLETEDPSAPLAKLVRTAKAGEKSYPEFLKEKIEGAVHPMIRRHPVTGEQALMVDQEYTVGIEGMTKEEAAPILGYLLDHITQPAFCCRLRWEPDMLVLWDNRLCVHQAFNDYQGYRRELYRTTLA